MVKAKSKRSLEIEFDLKYYGISPIIFRGYTVDGKKLPVKLNGRLEQSFTPSIRRVKRLLRIGKAVNDYMITFSVTNFAVGAIDVIWLEDGKQQILEVPYKGKSGRAVLFKDRLTVKPVTFEAFLKGTEQRVTLNKEKRLKIVPQIFIKRRLFVAEKEYFATVNVKNQVAENIEVRWKQTGKEKSFVVSKGERFTKSLTFSGPNAKDDVSFEAVSKQTNAKVKLNSLDIVKISPQLERTTKNLVARMNYYVLLKFENLAKGAVEVKWSENSKEKTIIVNRNSEREMELDFDGVDADRRIKLEAKLKEFNKIIQLNGKNILSVRPKPNKVLTIIRLTEKFYIDMEIENDAAKGIVLVWKINKERRTLDIAKGMTKRNEIVFDGVKSASPVRFEAFVEGDDARTTLDGKDYVVLDPQRRRNTVKIVARKDFYLDLQVKNQVGEPIEVKWQEDGLDKFQVISPYETSLVSIKVAGQNADKPIKFWATIKDKEDVVELDEKRSVTFVPQIKRSAITVIATAYKVRLVNRASGDVTVRWRTEQDFMSLGIPSKEVKEKYVNFDKPTDSLIFTGINKKIKTPVLINGTKQFTLFKDSRQLTVTVDITDGKY